MAFSCTTTNSLRHSPPSVTMSNMKISRQAGFANSVTLGLIVCVVLLLGSIGFGAWAYMSRQDYKNNSDQKADEAAADERKKTQDEDAVRYAEEAKNPLTTHRGPEAFGGVVVKYPKTWSGYVGGRGNTPVDDYFHPKVVSDISNRDNAYALRIQVVDRAYDAVLKTYDGAVNTKRLKAAPFSLPGVKNVVGTRLDGLVEQKKQGRLIVLPIRNMTLKIWTESPRYLNDFNKIILPNIVFSP